jgi:hypothetical protein
VHGIVHQLASSAVGGKSGGKIVNARQSDDAVVLSQADVGLGLAAELAPAVIWVNIVTSRTCALPGVATRFRQALAEAVLRWPIAAGGGLVG